MRVGAVTCYFCGEPADALGEMALPGLVIRSCWGHAEALTLLCGAVERYAAASSKATATEAMGAVVAGYRSGMRHRVLDALAEVRDHCAWFMGRADALAEWDDPAFRLQCVLEIERVMAKV